MSAVRKEEESRKKNRRTYPFQPDEFANLPPLLLDGQALPPGYGAGIAIGVLVRRALVVKVRELVKLVVGEEPEVEDGRREGRMNLSAADLHEGPEWEGHLLELRVEILAPPRAAVAHAAAAATVHLRWLRRRGWFLGTLFPHVFFRWVGSWVGWLAGWVMGGSRRQAV